MAVVKLKARLKWELMVKESEACIIAIGVSMTATIVAVLTRRVTIEEKDNITDEVSPKVMSIIF